MVLAGRPTNRVTYLLYQIGTTALAAYVRGDKYTIAHVGDSRALLFNSRIGTPKVLTRNHCPNHPDELKRVLETPGGFIENGRVNGKLAVTRALGDGNLQPYLTSIPDVIEASIDPDDEFLLLASDGLWNAFCGGVDGDEEENVAVSRSMEGYQEVVSIVAQSMSTSQAAKKLCEVAYARGSEDNISVVVIYLNFKPNDQAPTPMVWRSTTSLTFPIASGSGPLLASSSSHSLRGAASSQSLWNSINSSLQKLGSENKLYLVQRTPSTLLLGDHPAELKIAPVTIVRQKSHVSSLVIRKEDESEVTTRKDWQQKSMLTLNASPLSPSIAQEFSSELLSMFNNIHT